MDAQTHTDLPWDLISPPTSGLSIGIVLQGTYRIVRPLAEGGCGEIYLAAHTRLPGRFAVKLLHRSLVRDKDALSRFRQEAEITSSLRHPHIVQVFDFNVTDAGVPYLVMELLEGKLLAQRIASVGAMDPAAAGDIVEQIASALHAAHARGIVHRDLKPENIMLLSDAGVADFVKVLDFGISQASWRPRLTDGERVAGTPQYMAPEQACGLREQIDHRSDQFSLAAIAYTLLTGREPFRGENAIAVLYEVVHTDPVLPSQIIPALSPEIEAVIMKGLAKESADRYPNVLEFASALRAAIHGGSPAAFTDPTCEPPPVRTPTPVLVAEPPRALQAESELYEPIDSQPALMPVGRDTVRLLRRMRWMQARARLRVAALVAAAAMAALVWWSPATRLATRAAWRHAGTQMQIMVERVLPNREIRP
ncbi:MAG TPA: serine/threonine-protein kinase [Polyangia bacterium]|jgi:serine/threonine-protein kinase